MKGMQATVGTAGLNNRTDKRPAVIINTEVTGPSYIQCSMQSILYVKTHSFAPKNPLFTDNVLALVGAFSSRNDYSHQT